MQKYLPVLRSCPFFTGLADDEILSILHCCLVVGGGFSLLKGDRAGGTAWQAVTKAIAEILPHQLCLAVDDVDGSLVAGGCAQPAAVAFFFVNMDDLPNHIYTLLLWVFLHLQPYYSILRLSCLFEF